MVRTGLLVVGVIAAGALWTRAADADIRIGIAGDMTGTLAWFGEQYQRAAELAVEELNAEGGVLDQRVELIVGDDFCDPDQAVALAQKLASDGVVFVVGHLCSHSSIAAAKVYEKAKILMISPSSASAKLTDDGGPNVFRVCGRDDRQGIKVADYLADHWAGKKIAILHDNTTFGKGLAELTKKQLNDRGVTEAIYQAYIPAQNNYGAEIDALYAADIAVAFVGGYHTEIVLMARAAHDRGYPVQLIAGLNLATEEFGLIAGRGAEGTLFIDNPDARRNAEAAPVVERFRASGIEPEGYTLNAYGAVQVWAQAAEKAGSLELQAMIASLRQHQFDTVLGPIGFDGKGDVTLQSPVLYAWHADGEHTPPEEAAAKE